MKPSEALLLHRDSIHRIIAAHRASNARVLGSVLRGADTESSDLDILIGPTSRTTMMDIGAIRHEPQTLLGISVDVLTPNALPETFRSRVIAEAQPL